MDVGWMNFSPNQFGGKLFPFEKKKTNKQTNKHVQDQHGNANIEQNH